MDNSDFEKIIKIASKDTKKGADIAARVFYRILRRNGFSENQIINTATNIISCLTRSLKSYEKKIETDKTLKEEDTVKTSSKFSNYNNSVMKKNKESYL
jgi:hypothetical protein